MRLAATAELTPDTLASLRALLATAFDDFTDDDWDHGLGGVHVLVEDGDLVVAHAVVVPRTLLAGDRRWRTGYVENVAAAPDRRGRGLGRAVADAATSLVAAHYELGALSTGIQPFYERLGWLPWWGRTAVALPSGDVQPTPDDDDSVMVLPTQQARPSALGELLVCDWRRGDVW